MVCISYRLRSRVTSRLDLRHNPKVITDYRNLGIIHILTDLVVSSRYLPSILRGAPSSAVLRKASSCGLDHPWGRSPCSLPWVSRVVPPTISDWTKGHTTCQWFQRWMLFGSRVVNSLVSFIIVLSCMGKIGVGMMLFHTHSSSLAVSLDDIWISQRKVLPWRMSTWLVPCVRLVVV